MGSSGFSWKLEDHPKLPKGETDAVVVLDGWGEAKPDQYNCIHVAETPTMDSLRKGDPDKWRLVKAHGSAVGLPTEDDMGNSEVGDNALGAGRIFAQGFRFTKTNGSVGGQQENSNGQEERTEAASVSEGKDEGIGGGEGDQDEVTDGAVTGGGGDQDEGSDGGITGSGGGDQDEGSDGGITGSGGGDQDEGRDRGKGGGGGNREGNKDVEEGRSRVGDVEKALGGKNSRPMKIVEIFIAVIAQSTAAVIAVDFLGISTGTKALLYCALITNLFGFVCCTAALWQSNTHPETAKLLGKIGSAAATLGFILMVAMILPIYLLWIIGVACLALLVVFVISLKSS